MIISLLGGCFIDVIIVHISTDEYSWSPNSGPCFNIKYKDHHSGYRDSCHEDTVKPILVRHIYTISDRFTANVTCKTMPTGVQCNSPLYWIYVRRSWDYKSYDNEAKTHLGIFNPKTDLSYHCMLKPLPVRKCINRCTCKLKKISFTLDYVIRTCIKHVGQNSDKSGSGTAAALIKTRHNKIGG